MPLSALSPSSDRSSSPGARARWRTRFVLLVLTAAAAVTGLLVLVAALRGNIDGVSFL